MACGLYPFDTGGIGDGIDLVGFHSLMRHITERNEHEQSEPRRAK